jgi:serine/threonine protein kinase
MKGHRVRRGSETRRLLDLWMRMRWEFDSHNARRHTRVHRPRTPSQAPLVYDAGHADMWALGILTYDTIVGMSPFSNFDSRETGINSVSAVYSKILAFKEPLESPESAPLDSTNKSSIWELALVS